MTNTDKQRNKLLQELEEMRQRIAGFERALAEEKNTVQALWGMNNLQSAIIDSLNYTVVSIDLNGRILTFLISVRKVAWLLRRGSGWNGNPGDIPLFKGSPKTC